MSELLELTIENDSNEIFNKKEINEHVFAALVEKKYNVISNNETPWGSYFRLDNNDSEMFIKDFFTDIDINQIKLGKEEIELSPKILLVAPNQRLSWQYHARRAEIWVFLTDGYYIKSKNNIEGELTCVKSGDMVQFEEGERHRLVGGDSVVLVAEIWQHLDVNNLSDEDDIIRLTDDYSRK